MRAKHGNIACYFELLPLRLHHNFCARYGDVAALSRRSFRSVCYYFGGTNGTEISVRCLEFIRIAASQRLLIHGIFNL